jgi:MFS family permease
LLWFATIAFGVTIMLGSLEPRWSWYVLTHYFYRYPEDFSNVLMSAILVIAVPAYATVGAIVASLRPKNGVGWLCLALSLIAVLVSWQPTDGRLEDLPGVLSELAWFLIVPPLAVTLMLLIFPDGRLLSRRWWVVVLMALASPLIGLLMELFNAYHVARLVQDVGWLASLVALIASVVAIVLRWLRSRGRERQQIKLLVYAVTGTVVALLVAFASSYILVDIPGAQSPLSMLAFLVGFGSIALGIPVAIGIALLKYRLYDVDTVINRTLVYGTLTATLVVVYFGGIIVLQRIFVFLTGQQSTLAVVASTLLIAALFTPLRRRIQSFIDRRFYRKKYDARKTLEAFSIKLRDETNLDALSAELVGVVGETMQPTHVSLWLRSESPKSE